MFAGKHGFITLRDLFRWAERYRLAEQLQKDYDWLQHLANDGELCCPSFFKCLQNCFPAPFLKCKFLLPITQVVIVSLFLCFVGFMLLAGRVRKQEEVDVIQNVIEKHFKKKIYPESLFSGESVKKLLGEFPRGAPLADL